MPIPTATLFPNLPAFPGEGLVELPITNNSETKIKDFNHLIHGANLDYQPSFFISIESWEKLFNGLRADGTKWLPKGYEIFGFIFCIAFNDDHPFPRAYFRIRTVIKGKKIHSNEKEIKAVVEIDNIAYVDIEKALRHPNKDCTVFINPTSTEYRRVNNAVKAYKENIHSRPVAFQTTPPLSRSILNPPEPFVQEGNIFGRHSPFLVHNLKSPAKGAKIAFAWDKEKQSFSFIFNINPIAETQKIPCPVPYVGCATS